MKRLLLSGTLMLLSGCATYDVHRVRNPMDTDTLIGRTVPDLVDCMGVGYTFKQTKPNEGVLQWDRKDTSTGLKATVTLLGSIEIGGGGGCSVAFDVLRDGTVADVNFPNAYNDQLFAQPYGACRSLILECLNHPGSTGLPAGYDAFQWLNPTDKKP